MLTNPIHRIPGENNYPRLLTNHANCLDIFVCLHLQVFRQRSRLVVVWITGAI
jgi:hypothetical protein